MRLLLFAVFVLSIGAGTWWILSEHDDQDGAVIDISSVTGEPVDEAQHTEALTEEASDSVITQTEDDVNQQVKESIARVEDSTQDSLANDDSNTQTDNNSDTPFAVVGNESQDRVQPGQDDLVETVPATNSNVAVPQRETQNLPGTEVLSEVPDSYPVTEAEKYFIPREERGPGNLGGPPPLSFPGGPSDPDRKSD